MGKKLNSQLRFSFNQFSFNQFSFNQFSFNQFFFNQFSFKIHMQAGKKQNCSCTHIRFSKIKYLQTCRIQERRKPYYFNRAHRYVHQFNFESAEAQRKVPFLGTKLQVGVVHLKWIILYSSKTFLRFSSLVPFSFFNSLIFLFTHVSKLKK